MSKEMLLESLMAEKATKKKSPKQYDIGSKISSHDLEHRIAQMIGHLNKSTPVKVIITGKKNEDTVGFI